MASNGPSFDDVTVVVMWMAGIAATLLCVAGLIFSAEARIAFFLGGLIIAAAYTIAWAIKWIQK